MNGWMQLQRIKRVEAKVGTTFVWIRAANTLIGAHAFFENVQPDWGGGFVLPASDNAIVYPDPEHDGVFVSVRLEVMREGIEDYELLMESARRAPERTDAMARTVIPAFTDYVRDVAQFREFERELLVLVTEAQKEK